MKKLSTKILSFILVLSMSISMAVPAFAAERNPYSVEGKYVQELIDLDKEQIKALSIKEAEVLFEKAFSVQTDDYTEDEIRLGLDGLAFGLKFQKAMDEIKATVETQPSYPSSNSIIMPLSTTGSVQYSGNIGVAWVRDTTSGHSPLTLGEILSGTYTLEVDFLTWDTAAAILAASANYNAFQDLAELVATGAAGTALSAYICSVLGITGGPATITSVAVGAVVGLGWNWLKNIDRSRMYDCFAGMNKSKNQYMKVQFMWSSNMVNKFYSTISKTSSISNPFSGKYGDWYKDRYGYLYSY